ncbi:mobilization protein MobC [Spirosoma oryzae]|uniref:Mobilization protein MobC n=1 Tax=Spirosoma oryzae TaxID=1469603 RepID=A0A2T0RFL9_9BACT|nr:plasmid mobilization relaxosome protein MobC [Spirosoma oryzae]PRY19963.1 mobilization protein MobC [Spirosoma oryzae]
MENNSSKTHRLDLRVTEAECQQIAQRAAAAGLKMSEYLRRSALCSAGLSVGTPGGTSLSMLTKPERAQLASLANNLNQLTRYAHTGQLDVVGIHGLISQLNQLLS